MTTSTRFARSPSLQIGDDDPFSSPDPLALSVNDENSFPGSSPIKGASPSPRKNRRTTVLEDITLSSPQKGRKRSIRPSNSAVPYQSEQFLSPWKIRVTVEAEPEEPGFARMRSISKTTTVPLRDPASPTRDSAPRGRSNSASRKSGSAIRARGSPARRGRKSVGADFSRLTDLDTTFLDDHETTQSKPKRKQGTRKPRKASGTEGAFKAQDTVSCAAKPERDAKLWKAISNEAGDTGLEQDAGMEAVLENARGSPELRELDFNRISVRSRGGPAKAANIKIAEDIIIGHEKSPISGAISSAAREDKDRHVSGASAITYPTPDASVQDDLEAHGPPSDPTEDNAGFDTMLESEGFTMIDLESLPSARHFVTSPDNSDSQHSEPSASDAGAADLEHAGSVPYPVLALLSPLKSSPSPTKLSQAKKPRATPIPSYLAPPEEGESDLSSTVPSSPPVQSNQRTILRSSNLAARSPLRQAHTPLASTKSSPTLPSPPNQPPKAKQLILEERAKSTPPRLGRVVRAGIALQGLLSPKARAPSLQPSPIPKETDLGKRSASTPQDRLDNLFVGFDSGTRRELRAGLRFGEELAKRQRLASPEPSISAKETASMPHQQVRQEIDTAWRGETLVKRTPVRCNDLSATKEMAGKTMDVSASQTISRAQTCTTPFDANRSCGSIFFLDAEARERRWQAERETISRQIENANTSQVIVIESDDETEIYTENGGFTARNPSPTKSIISEAEEDIWLAEAEVAQNSSRHTAEDLFPPAEQIRQRERAKEVISKPRRTLIPSPWKREEDVDTTFMKNDDASGMFWQQNGSKEVISSLRGLLSKSQAQQAPKRNFDIQRMIGESSAQRQQTSATKGESWEILEDISQNGPDGQSICQNEVEAWGKESELVGNEDLDIETVQHRINPANEEFSEAEIDPEAPSGNGEETYEGSSIAPGPTKVPVNFNDTTELSVQSRDDIQNDTQRQSPQCSPQRPVTPRSALKGSRASLNVIHESETPTPRRVIFSRHSLCLDDSGLETSMQVRGDSLSSDFSTASDAIDCSEIQPVISEAQQTGEEREDSLHIMDARTNARAPAPRQTGSTSWFSKLTGWGSKPALAPGSDLAPKEEPQQQRQQSSKAGQLGSDIKWERTNIALTSSHVAAFNARSAASLESPPNASDPRFPPPPETLPVSGYFSDNHYKHLHILYLKSLKSTFTRPGSIRPALKQYIGQKCYSGDGEFAWEVTQQDAEAVERWIRSFEGRQAREVVEDWSDGEGRYRKIGWDEWDLCKRLFSIVAGQEVRREEKERGGKERRDKR
jgi:hypothetical protein